MPRKNEGRRRGGGSGRRKSGEFKTCKEGASFVRLETVCQARKKKGEEEEGPRTGTNAEVRQLNGEVQRLNNKVDHQAKMIAMLKAALIGSMSRTMYRGYLDSVAAADDSVDTESEHWKESALTDAKHEGITAVVRDMIHMTHEGVERNRYASKLAVETFGGVVGFNDYPYEDMAYDEKSDLNDFGMSMFQYRLFLECREIDWKQALEEEREFHDYQVFEAARNYFVEKMMLLGEPVPHGHAGYVIPEFP